MSGSKLAIALVEFIGTFVFLSVILAVANPDAKGYAPLAIGLALAGLIWFAWNISGGHFNPAVTTMSMMKGSTDVMTGIFYILAQILGAVAAVMFSRYMK